MNKKISCITALFLIQLVLTLPVSFALVISHAISPTGDISYDSAEITWTTDQNATSRIDYGQTSSLGSIKEETNLTKTHTIAIGGLEPTTKYYYSITSANESGYSVIDDNNGNYYYFTTIQMPDIFPPIINSTTLTLPSDTEAAISWYTNESSTSFIYYGGNSSLGQIKSNNAYVTSHSLTLTDLTTGATYYYKVNSCDRSNNCANFTPSINFFEAGADIEPPAINVTIPEFYNSAYLVISGYTEPYSIVQLYIDNEWNGQLSREMTGAAGYISFSRTLSETPAEHTVKITAEDLVGNKNEKSYSLVIDTKKPEITMTAIPSVTTNETITLSGSVDEPVVIQFYSALVSTTDSTAPPKVENLSVFDVDTNSAAFNWADSAATDLANYIVYRDDIAIAKLTKTERSYEDEYLSTNTTYLYKVSAVDTSCNEGAKSDPLTVNVLAGGYSINQTPDSISTACGAAQNAAAVVNTSDVFEVSIPVAEGNNLIYVNITDRANNNVVIENNTLVDKEKPEFLFVSPPSGAFFYEEHAQAEITGNVSEGNVIVGLYFGREADGNPDYTAYSDSTGSFSIGDVDLEGCCIGDECGGLFDLEPSFELALRCYGNLDEIPQQEPGETLTDWFRRIREEQPLRITLTATDAVGNTGTFQIYYTIGSCTSGNMAYSVINRVEYQSPSSLSPERLEEGTEIISFIIELKYQGGGASQEVTAFDIIPQQESYDMLGDINYKYSLDLLSSSNKVIVPNENKTLLYVRYRLGKIGATINESVNWDEVWKSLSAEMVFPFQAVVEYEHDVYGGSLSGVASSGGYIVPSVSGGSYGVKREHLTQKSCFPISYHLDTSRIEPRDILPDWLLNDGADFLNETLTTINEDIMPVLEDALEYTGLACIAGVVVKLVYTIFRRYSCWQDTITDKFKSENDKEKCPKPGEGQDCLSSDELNTKCNSCSSAWETEKNFNNAYRLACDRFLCHGTPARWTESATKKEIDKSKERAIECAGMAENTAVGNALPVLKCDDNDQEVPCAKDYMVTDEDGAPASIKEYYNYRSGRYVLTLKQEDYIKQSYSPEKGGVYTHNQGNMAYLKRITTGGGDTKLYIKKYIESTKEVHIGIPDTNKKKCIDACKDKGYDIGLCNKYTNDFVKELKNEGYKYYYNLGKGRYAGIGTDTDSLITGGDCSTEENSCVCASKSPTEEEKKKLSCKKGIAPDNAEWIYRYEKTGYYEYDDDRYYGGRDWTACFGQDKLLFGTNAPYLNPQSEFIPSFQCVCVSGIYNRIRQIRAIIQGALGCLNQIKVSGQADAGICKELFTQYVCDWVWNLISMFRLNCIPGLGKAKSMEPTWLQGVTDSVFGSVGEVSNDLMSDYENTAIQNYLGAGEAAVMRNICMGALTGDWGFDFEDIIDAAYEQPFQSSVLIFPATREYLTWNPDNMGSTYEYRAAWTIMPGCDISYYLVDLSCITRAELDKYPTQINCGEVRKVGVVPIPSGAPYFSPSGCDCLDRVTIDQARDGPSFHLDTGGSITQAGYESQDNSNVFESVGYRFDHVKITMIPKDYKDIGRCFPNGQNVFYAPISDETKTAVQACRFDQAAGFVCDQGGLLWDLKGTAYFVSETINNQLASSGMTIDQGKELTIWPTIYKMGPDKCLRIRVYSSDINNPDNKDNEYFLINKNGTNPYFFAPVVTSVNPTISGDYIVSGQSTSPATGGTVSGVLVDSTYDGEIASPTITFYDESDAQGNGGQNNVIDLTPDSKDKYQIGSGNKEEIGTNFKSNNNVLIVSIAEKSIKVKVTGVVLPNKQQGTTTTDATNLREDSATYTIKVTPPATTSSQKKIKLELLHLKEGYTQFSGKESCNDVDIISYRGLKQTKEYTVNIGSGTTMTGMETGGTIEMQTDAPTVTLNAEHDGTSATGTPPKLTINQGEEVIFNVMAMDDKKNDLKYSLDFNDNTLKKEGTIMSTELASHDTMYGKNFEEKHTYNSVGTYTAKLTVTDSDGKTGEATVQIEVINLQPPSGFSGTFNDVEDDKKITAGDTITVTWGSVEGVDGYKIEVSFDKKRDPFMSETEKKVNTFTIKALPASATYTITQNEIDEKADNAPYYFRIQSYKGSATSDWSNQIEVKP